MRSLPETLLGPGFPSPWAGLASRLLPSSGPQLDTSAAWLLAAMTTLSRRWKEPRERQRGGEGRGRDTGTGSIQGRAGHCDPREQWARGAELWTPGHVGPGWQEGGWPGPCGLAGVWKRRGLQRGREEQSRQGKYKTSSRPSSRPAGSVLARAESHFL